MELNLEHISIGDKIQRNHHKGFSSITQGKIYEVIKKTSNYGKTIITILDDEGDSFNIGKNTISRWKLMKFITPDEEYLSNLMEG